MLGLPTGPGQFEFNSLRILSIINLKSVVLTSRNKTTLSQHFATINTVGLGPNPSLGYSTLVRSIG